MPQLLALLPVILGGIGAGTGIASAVGGGDSAKPAGPAGPSAADAAKTSKNQQAALAGQFPNIQSATGGSLSPEAWIQMAQLLEGKAGDPSFGAAGQDLLQKLTSGSGLTPAGSTFG